jgi:hypothetical protein
MVFYIFLKNYTSYKIAVCIIEFSEKFSLNWCKLFLNLMPSLDFRKNRDPEKRRVLASLSRVFGVKIITTFSLLKVYYNNNILRQIDI